jgi:transposase
MMLVEGMRSERQLVKFADLNLAHRWLLGCHLDQPLPDRSSGVKIRQRLGLPVFRRFFEHVVDLCEDAGLIWGKEVLADATRVPGNASMNSFVVAVMIWRPKLHFSPGQSQSGHGIAVAHG